MARCSPLKTPLFKLTMECKICSEPFKYPKMLPCYHNFCLKCLAKLTVENGQFKCPICCMEICVPCGGMVAFPNTFYVTALHDFVCTNRKDQHVLCVNDRCNAACTGHKKAIVKCIQCNCNFCEDCRQGHRLIPAVKNHEEVQLCAMTARHYLQIAKHHQVFCSLHKDKPLSYYCRGEECNKPICQDCCLLIHKFHYCVTLQEEAAETRSAIDFIVKDTIKEHLCAISKARTRTATYFDELNHMEIDIKWTIKNAARKAMQLVQAETQKALEHTTQMVTALRRKVGEYEVANEAKEQMLHSSKEILENIRWVASDAELTNLFQEMEKIASATLKNATPSKFNYEEGVQVQVISEPLVKLNLAVIPKKPEIRLTKTIKAFEEVITDIAIHDDMLIFLSKPARKNSQVLVQCRTDNDMACCLERRILRACPKAYRMVSMRISGEPKLAVTDISHQEGGDPLRLVSVYDNIIETLDHLGAYDASAVTIDLNGQLIFTDCNWPKAVKRITNSQTLEILFQNSHSCELLRDPWRICTNITGDIIVSDGEAHAVFIFTEDGEIVNKYTDFNPGKYENYPNGVCSDENGYIYVADRNGNCIHRLSKTGDFLNYTLTKYDGIENPICLFYKSPRLYVGDGQGYVKVYQFSGYVSDNGTPCRCQNV